jgi:outer membrane protein assembly factor BamB
VDDSTGIVYTVGQSGEIHAINGADGTQEWTATVTASYATAVAVDGSTGTVYVGDNDDSVEALDATDGTQKWTYGKFSDYVVGLTVDQSTGTVYAGSDGGEVHAIGGSDGIQEWTYTQHSGGVEDLAVDPSTETIYSAGGYQDNTVHAIDGLDGTQEWVYTNHTSGVYGVAFDGSKGTVYSASDDGELHAILAKQVTDSPAVDIDSDGANDLSYSGKLSDGETYSESVTLSTGHYSSSVTTETGKVDVNISFTERTQTKNPTVEIVSESGTQTIGGSSVGTLADGEVTDLSDEIDESRIGGNVTVSVNVSESVSSGPIGKVGLEFSHTATEDRSIDYQGEEFSERYSTSYTWTDDRSDAKMRIPWASDRIVSVRTVTVDGTEISDYQTSGGELIVPIGSVSAGETTNVSATGSKIQLESGSVEVVEPTTVGNNLDSKIKITDAGGGEVRIDVSGVRTVDDEERVLYTRQESWTDPDPRAELSPGEQILVLEAPSSGSTARIRSSDIGARAVEGDAVVRVLDSSEPRLKVSSGDSEGDVVELIYHDTVSGDHYRVTDADSSDVLDTDQAESPVRLRVSDTSGILSIESFVPNAAVNAAAGAVSGGGDGSLFGPIVLVVVVVAAIGALAILSRRTGLLESREGTAIVSLGILIVGYIAAELVTGRDLYRGILGVLSDSVGGAASVPGSIIGSIVSSVSGFGFGALVLGVGLLVGLFAIDQRTEIDIPRFGWIAALGLIGVWFLTTIGASLESPIAGDQLGAVLVAIAIPIALLALDQRTSLSIPIPLYIGVALVDGVFVLETLSPGGVLEPLSSGLDEIGPLIWILLIGGAMVVIWLWLRSRRPEITIRGGGGS